MRDEQGTYWERWNKRRASRRQLLGAGGLGIAGLATAALVGCGDDDSGGKGGGEPTKATGATAVVAAALPDHEFYKGIAPVRRGGKFTWAQSDDPVGGDPHSHEEPGTQALTQPVYNELFMPYENKPGEQTIMGELVEKWEQVSPTEVVLHLRPGVKFQNVDPVNGREFVASDVAFNINRWKETRPENRLRGMFDSIASVETPDNYTAKLKLSEPYAPLFNHLGFTWAAIIPKELVDKGVVERKPVGTGPFILDKWERGVGATWKRNPAYWKPNLPNLDALEMLVIADRAVREAKFLAKETDAEGVNILGDKETTIQSNMQNLRDKVGVKEFWEQQGAFGSTLKFYMNVAHKPFDDPRVRQALSAAFPYETMIASFAAGRGLRSGPESSGNTKWAMREADLPKFDAAKAKQLLSAAGIDTLKSEMWVSPQYSGSTLAPIVAGLLKQSIGAEIAIKSLENAQWISDVYRAAADYPCTTHGDWSFDDPDRTLREYFHSKGSAAHYNIKDTKLDEMLDKQRKELSEPARITQVQDIQKYIMEQGYVQIFFTIGSITALAPWVTSRFFRGGNVNSYRIRDIASVAETSPRAKA
jgi:peptide/nickel transport system substrate-binding protein